MLKKISCLIFCIISTHLFGGIENYFKWPQLDSSSSIHHMRNIDFIYTINLDQRPEKFTTCTAQLHPFGIFPYRFSAVNGWELSLEDFNNLGVKYEPWMRTELLATTYEMQENSLQSKHTNTPEIGITYFCHYMSRGAVGIVLSHLSILQHAYTLGFQTIWVMEDDIEIIQNPHVISDLIDKLDALVGHNGWDILFTDLDTKNQQGENVPCLSYALRPNFTPPDPYKFIVRSPISADFRIVGARYGAYSMIVRRSGMEKILNFIKHYGIFLPFDMDFTLPLNMRLFTLNYDVVSTQSKALSDNGKPAYLQKNQLAQ